jgi:hypothetical protein
LASDGSSVQALASSSGSGSVGVVIVDHGSRKKDSNDMLVSSLTRHSERNGFPPLCLACRSTLASYTSRLQEQRWLR